MSKLFNNVPDYVQYTDFCVFRWASDKSLWFYGAYDTVEKASEVAREFGSDGIIVHGSAVLSEKS